MAKSKTESISVLAPVIRETMLVCHLCKNKMSMALILAIQNDGPICRKCAGYENEIEIVKPKRSKKLQTPDVDVTTDSE